MDSVLQGLLIKMSILLVTGIAIISATSPCPKSTPNDLALTPVTDPETLKTMHNCLTYLVTTTYAPLDTIMNWYRSTAEVNKDLVKLMNIGKSVEDRDLMVMRVSPKEKDDLPAVYIEATQHAREWLAPVTLDNFINKLINGYTKKQEPYVSLFDKYIFYFESVSNPDGYVYSFIDDETRLWRKNRRKNTKCYGVDLNRNWNIDFGGEGASTNSCSLIYQGPSAFSEPETQAMRDFMLNTIGVGNLSLYISMHTFSQVWIIPYSYQQAKPENYDEMLSVANASSNAIMNQTCGNVKCYYEPINGYEYVGNATGGGSDDWVLKNMRANYSYTLELSPSSLVVTTNDGFMPGKDLIPTVANAIEIGLLTMLKLIKT